MAEPKLKLVVDEFDSATLPVHLIAVKSAVRKADAEPSDDPRDLAEVVAFSLHPFRDENDQPWGTRYGPMMTWPADDGKMAEYPGRHLITTEMIDYWVQRSRECCNPVLRHRYSDLVWDQSVRIGLKPSIDIARTAIDAAAESGGLLGTDQLSELHSILSRGLELALRISDPERVRQVHTAIVECERRLGTDDQMLGTWGFAFDVLTADGSIALPTEHESEIVSDLEVRLSRSISGPGDLHFVTEHAATRLVRHYQRKGAKADIARVLRVLQEATLRAARAASPMVGMAWVQQLRRRLLQYGLAREAARLDPLLAEMGKAALGDLHAISEEFEVPKEKMEAFVGALCEGTTEEALGRIAGHFIVDDRVARDELHKLVQQAPLQFMIPMTSIDSRGTILHTTSGYADDPEGRLVNHMAQSVQFSALFLRQALRRLQDSGSIPSESLLKYLVLSPAFPPMAHERLRRGLDAWHGADWVVALHLLTPILEDGIRELVRLNGGQCYTPNRYGGYHETTLGSLLEAPELVELLGGSTVFYLRVLLTDPRGLNIRNRIAHGLLANEEFNAGLADRIVHALLILALCRQEEKQDGSGQDGSEVDPTS